jgi:CheY-like chemotaxis protein
MERGRYVPLDAAQTLSKFMVDGAPDRKLFMDSVGQVVARMARRGRRIHAFGEMVALLWADGKRDAAIRLEELWNELAKSHKFGLFCAYPIAGFDDESDADPFAGICTSHSKVIPAESYNGMDHAEQRLRAIAALQQKAQSLEAEIDHRKAVERALSKRERDLLDYFDEYLAKLGHGLRNPLAAVQSGIELLQMELGDSLAADEVLNVMQLQVAELVGLVDELPQVRRIAEASMDVREEQPADTTTAKTGADIRRTHTPPTASAAESARRRILIVDDNQDSLDTLNRLLRMRKHEVRTARDGLEAIEIAGEFQPQVILMDVGMPRLDGYEATRRIRKLPGGPDMFVVALTGWGQPSDIEQARQAGCSAHLVKPVDFAELEQLVARCAAPLERS